MARRHDHRQADRRDWTRRCSSPASPTPGRCRSRRASTCCPPASARRSASRSSARTSTRWRSWPRQIEAVVKAVPGTTSAFAERITGGFYLNIEPDREQLARYGLAVGDLQDVIGTALGGEMVTTTVEGRERFGVTVRYPRELRSDPQQIAREVLVPDHGRRDDPAGAGGQGRRRQGSARHPHRERPALGLHLRRHPRPRHRRLRGRCEEGGGRTGQVPARLLRHLERPVRVHGARHREDEDRHPGHAADHLPAALPQLPAHHRDADRHAVGALRAGRRRLADVAGSATTCRWPWRSASSRWPAWRPRPA